MKIQQLLYGFSTPSIDEAVSPIQRAGEYWTTLTSHEK